MTHIHMRIYLSPIAWLLGILPPEASFKSRRKPKKVCLHTGDKLFLWRRNTRNKHTFTPASTTNIPVNPEVLKHSIHTLGLEIQNLSFLCYLGNMSCFIWGILRFSVLEICSKEQCKYTKHEYWVDFHNRKGVWF